MLAYVRVAACVPKLVVADCDYNVGRIIEMVKKAHESQVNVIVFPELSITGYTCADLFFQGSLIQGAENSLNLLLKETADIDMVIAVGVPVDVRNQLFNCAAICHKGKLLGLVPKMYLPNSEEFYERRWFSPAYDTPWDSVSFCSQNVPFGNNILFNCLGEGPIIGVEICQDVWEPIPPSSYQALAGANLILNLSASNEIFSKQNVRRSIVTGQSSRTVSAYVYSSSGIWESTTDLVFAGHSLICENGVVLAESDRFQWDEYLLIHDLDFELIQKERQKNNGFMACATNGGFRHFKFIDIALDLKIHDNLKRSVKQNPFMPENKEMLDKACEDIFNIQSIGLARRLDHIHAKKCVLAISGGLDSTLALLAAVKAMNSLGLPRENIIGITMPGFGTTGRTRSNAVKLMEALGITSREISIKDACIQHFNDIGQALDNFDVTFENAQARERTQIAMDIANMEGGLVVGTGDMSELALGFTTFNGDHMSMYSVNCGVPKTLVRILVKWVADTAVLGAEIAPTLYDIVTTPVSPELLPADEKGKSNQITEEIIGPYEVNDFFMYYILNFGFSPDKIIYLALQAFGDKYTKKQFIIMLKNFYKRFFTQQYKRSCAPDGPKAVEIGLSPRGDWRMPSDASYNIWVKALEVMENEL